MNNIDVVRSEYLDKIQAWVKIPMVKVLVGMRRVGKSTLLNQWATRLIEQKIGTKNSLLHIECDSLEYVDLREWPQLRDLVQAFDSKRKGLKVLLIDEVQLIDGWEKVITALQKQGHWDIYVTGSNSEMLSGELATLLSGRYVQIEIFPFSYAEHLQIRKQKAHSVSEFQRYLHLGGLPGLYHLPDVPGLAVQTLEAIFSTIVLHDVVQRYEVRNIALLERMVHYFFDNIGNLVNAKRIADYCKSQRLSVGVETVQNYTHYLESCFVVHRVRRHDLRGKRLMEVNEKLFIGDIGLRNAVLSRRTEDVGALLENLVYLELRRRGFQVSVGFFGEYEVDFVAEKNGSREYFQVCYQMPNLETQDREFRVLELLPDNYPKTVLSMDSIDLSRNGIAHVFLPQWMLL